MQSLKAMAEQVEAAPDQQVSLTDPDARSMATSGKGTGVVGYNVQVAVDANIERGRQLPTIKTLVDLGRELAVPLSDFLDGLDDVASGSGLSRERVQQEAKLREVVRGLSDRDLRLALTLAEVMTGR